MQIRGKGFKKLLQAFKKRFAPDIAKATRFFNRITLIFKNVIKDENAISQFFIRILYHARAIKILNKDNSNWYGIMVQIWARLKLEIKKKLYPFYR